jgi:hypothetical protein
VSVCDCICMYFVFWPIIVEHCSNVKSQLRVGYLCWNWTPRIEFSTPCYCLHFLRCIQDLTTLFLQWSRRRSHRQRDTSSDFVNMEDLSVQSFRGAHPTSTVIKKVTIITHKRGAGLSRQMLHTPLVPK